MNWFQSYSSNRFANTIFDVPASAMLGDLIKAHQLNAGNVYITDQPLPNPYAQLPSYWDQEVAAIASVPEPSSFTVVAVCGLMSLAGYARRRARFGAEVRGERRGRPRRVRCLAGVRRCSAGGADPRIPFLRAGQPTPGGAGDGALRRHGPGAENTASAIEQAIADGVEWVEVAVRLTKDGHHVVFHDESLDATTDGSGKVRDRTLAEIRALDAGGKVARRFAGRRNLTLEEGLELARGRVNLCLDLKDVDPARLARRHRGQDDPSGRAPRRARGAPRRFARRRPRNWR